MASPTRPLRAPGEQRRTDINRINEMTVKQTRVTGRVEITGSGEASADLTFPVVFAERPIFTFGAELANNSHATATHYPTISGFVDTWVIVDAIPGAFEGRFIGCRMLIVATGAADMHYFFDWAMEAKAIRNPIGESLTDTL